MVPCSIIVPTYNERENVPELLRRIADALPERTYEILIVDDDSPDGTADAAAASADEYPVRVIRRTGARGLATAVERGIAEAEHDVVVVLDADLQHPPERIPDMLAALEEGADVVIASRYVDGGDPGAFGPLRWCVSRIADGIARLAFDELSGVSDVESGFFALDRSVIEDVELDPIGYKILLEVLVRGDYDEVREIGYEFRARKRQETKFGPGAVVDYLHHLVRLKARSRT